MSIEQHKSYRNILDSVSLHMIMIVSKQTKHYFLCYSVSFWACRL